MTQPTALTIRRGRAADHFDYLEDTTSLARDIARAAYEDVVGPHVAKHRKEKS